MHEQSQINAMKEDAGMLAILQEMKGDTYARFITEACKRCDKFSLIRTNYTQSYYKRATLASKPIRPYRIKSKAVNSWPDGGPGDDWVRENPDYPYKSIMDVYKVCDETRDFLISKERMYKWCPPDLPEDLSFYRGEDCWFACIAHEEGCAINTNDRCDRLLLMDMGVPFRQTDIFIDYKLKL